ncbi:MAG: hypothetical protein FWB80_08885 [Defluviitaleaceae bacterium]|nr:hypothetical protein [Defluviitaleaceae bacterium]
MIEQHMYTRARRGLYKTTAGYDTVAKSAGLADDFVKGTLHPLCVYGGGDKSITLVNLPDGRIFLGQAVSATDFTGQRTAFFMHNYILPAKMAGDTAEVSDTKFETSCEENDGSRSGELQIIEKLPHEPDKTEFLSSADFDSIDFEYLARCATAAVVNSKKFYVRIPPEALDKHNYSCAAMAKIYEFLPEGVRHVLGFCTYSREAERRSGVHLIFTDNDELAGAGNNTHPTAEFNLSARIAKLSYTNFFTEMSFWHVRTPHLRDFLHNAEIIWLDNNLDKLTPRQFATIPTDFIKRGKNSGKPAMYVVVSIIKKAGEALLANREIDLRYLPGSYLLSEEARCRITRVFASFG